jgi:glycosyltransferase involved in cell wall biosynthesis
MQKKILIHLPNLPGGKKNYFSAIHNHFQSDITYFYCGSQGKKESRFAFIRRLFGDYWRFYRLLKTEGFQIVHINPSLKKKSFLRDSIFTLISCLVGVKTVVFWHGWRWDYENKVVSKIRPYFHFTYGKADAMVVLAREFLDRIKWYGYNNPVYLETTVVEDHIMDFQGSNGQPPDKKEKLHILFLSRVEKAKGIYELLDSFHRLQKKYPHIRLQIAGTGTELPKVRQYVAEQGIRGVAFLGWINGLQKAEVYHNAQLFVLPSYSEGLPCALLEAMASGLAVITTDVGGIKDFFEPEKMGLVVAPRNTDDLEQKMDQLLSDRARLYQTGAYNARYARDRFSTFQVIQRLEAIYEFTYSGKAPSFPAAAMETTNQ